MTTQARILVIDDEPQMRRLLQRSLEEASYRVLAASTGAEGRRMAETERPDVIVLDLGLPDMDGIEVLRNVRSWTSTPVLILSVRNSEETIIAALDAGADDYLTKPYRSGEMLARIRALLRHRASGDDQRVFRGGGLSVDREKRVVMKAGAEVKLTPIEYALLEYFVENAGKVLTHQMILRRVWGPAHAEETQYLRVYVGQLRKKLERDPSKPEIFLTESGIGYRFGPG